MTVSYYIFCFINFSEYMSEKLPLVTTNYRCFLIISNECVNNREREVDVLVKNIIS